MGQLWARGSAALALFSMTIIAAGQGKGDSGKLSGIFFGDLYSVGDHHNPKINGRDGIWNRRINLSYDRKLDAAWSMRLRIEFKDPGNFSSEHSIDPFMKDAWLRYSINGHRITFGLIPTPSYEAAEEKLGYRPIERTLLDLYRMGSSRDKGISLQGPIDTAKIADYTLMVGDGSGTKASTSGLHTVYGRVGYKATPEVYFNIYADFWRKAAGARWNTWMGEAFYTGNGFKLGLSYANQRRTRPGASALSFNVLSLYGEATLSEAVRPFVRFDVVSEALPDADKIDYYAMSKQGKPTLLQVGVRYRVNDHLEVVPNITTVSYRRGPGGVTPSQDVIFRLTFSLKF